MMSPALFERGWSADMDEIILDEKEEENLED
jgi:hypothetical protein